MEIALNVLLVKNFHTGCIQILMQFFPLLVNHHWKIFHSTESEISQSLNSIIHTISVGMSTAERQKFAALDFRA